MFCIIKETKKVQQEEFRILDTQETHGKHHPNRQCQLQSILLDIKSKQQI